MAGERLYRTLEDDRLPRDPVTGRDFWAGAIYRSEDLSRFGSDMAWLRRADEQTALTGGGRRRGHGHGHD
jgi:hypothetical protein